MYRKSVKASPASASHVNSPRTKYARPSTAQGAGVARVDLRAAPRGPNREEGKGGGAGGGASRTQRLAGEPERKAGQRGQSITIVVRALLKEPEIDCGSVRFPRPGPTMLRLDDPGQNGFGQRRPDRSRRRIRHPHPDGQKPFVPDRTQPHCRPAQSVRSYHRRERSLREASLCKGRC